MKKSVKTMVCLGLAALSLGIYAPGQGLAQEPVTMSLPQKMDNGETIEVYYRKGNSVDAPRARGAELKSETLLLKAGTIRREGAKPLTCDIVMEKDVLVTLRDGTVIYTDIFRPNDNEKHPAIMAWSPYGKEIGGQQLDDVPMRSGVPLNATSGLEKFEGPDPAYWVAQGYVIINPDSRGAYHSEGNLNYWGSQNSKDGYDTIEWAASQPWSNGKIGMSGNSWLTVSQWFIAGEQPPHLAAIAPWEGFVDHFRETANRGGIPNPIFPEAIFDTFASKNYIEDQPRMVVTHTLMNAYWQDKIAKLENISIPAYVVASYTNPVHTHGTFAGFRQIKSKDKWLRVHNTNEWYDYYQPEHVEDLRKFFDHYLKDEDNGWEKTAPVRLSVLDLGHEDVVDREEKEFPLARTEYRKLYLTAEGKLSDKEETKAAAVSYQVESTQPRQVFTYTFDQDTELTGYMNLHTYVEAAGSNDMELHVAVEKLDEQGNVLKDRLTGQPVAAEGYLRVSQRDLDKSKSTPAEPYLKHDHEDLLKAGEIVPVDIGIWPMGMKYHKGESLRLTIEPYNAPGKEIIPAFGSAKITVPQSGYTYDPKEKPAMKTLGGQAETSAHPEYEVKAPATRNKGQHIFHIGGKYDSFLLVPVVPEK